MREEDVFLFHGCLAFKRMVFFLGRSCTMVLKGRCCKGFFLFKDGACRGGVHRDVFSRGSFF